MKLHELQPAEGSRKERNRVGRGQGSGNGKTAGRGSKGQKARSGGGVRLGFEGGQTPLFRRIPKRGFQNINRKEYAVVNLGTLNRFEDGQEVTAAVLVEAGIVKNEKDGIKVLANGKLERKLTVKANKFSQAAKEAIEAAGGPVRAVVELAGISDVTSKSLGSNTPVNMVRATIEGLKQLKRVEDVAALRGKSVEELLG